MKKILLFVLILLVCNTIFAQDYAPLPDTGIRRYFTNSAGYLRGIRVDSVVQENGYKRYVTFRTPRGRNNNSGNFTDSSGACWLGKNVRAYANGDWHFPNIAGDTILVKTGAKVGDTWAFHRDTSTIWTEATVLSIDTQTVFGVLDSVKRIQLTLKNGNTALSANLISAFKVVLGKTMGFAQVPDLHLFPYKDLDSTPNNRDIWYRYLGGDGYSNPLIVESLLFNNIIDWNPSNKKLYDLHVGDVTYKGHYLKAGPTSSYFLDTVTARQDFPTYTDYTYNRWFWQYSTNQNGPTFTVQNSIVPVRVTNEVLFDTTYMPEEYHAGCHNMIYITFNDSSYCSRNISVRQKVGYVCGLNLNNTPLYYPRKYVYKQGLGLTAYWEEDYIGLSEDEVLYGYVKNGVPCGSISMVPSGVKNISLKSTDFKLYPQPATTEVFLEAPQLRYPATIRIQNLQGQLLSTQQITAAGEPISTAGLPAGLYLLSVTDAGGNSAVQKILIGTE